VAEAAHSWTDSGNEIFLLIASRADPRTRAAIGEDAFRSDLLSTAGLDDRRSSHGYLSRPNS
jgi:hypothetical protein